MHSHVVPGLFLGWVPRLFPGGSQAVLGKFLGWFPRVGACVGSQVVPRLLPGVFQAVPVAVPGCHFQSRLDSAAPPATVVPLPHSLSPSQHVHTGSGAGSGSALAALPRRRRSGAGLRDSRSAETQTACSKEALSWYFTAP